MEKTDDVFFEIVLKNANHILTEAAHQKELQNARLHMLRSSDRTADAAIDNLTGGRISIESNGQLRFIRNGRAWAGIIEMTKKHYAGLADQKAYRVLQGCYLEGRRNADVLRRLKLSRPVFFSLKDEIKNFVRAAACEMGLWRVMRPKG